MATVDDLYKEIQDLQIENSKLLDEINYLKNLDIIRREAHKYHNLKRAIDKELSHSKQMKIQTDKCGYTDLNLMYTGAIKVLECLSYNAR